jgi:Leucine-rich repeat (LRR) protein
MAMSPILLASVTLAVQPAAWKSRLTELTAADVAALATRAPDGATAAALDLSSHALQKPGPALASVSSLRRLSLACNALSTLAGLPALPALEVLDVAYNDLRTLFPLPPLPALAALHVRRHSLRCTRLLSVRGWRPM